METKNTKILSLIYIHGYRFVAEFCRGTGLSVVTVGEVINGILSPRKKNGEYRNVVLNIASALHVVPSVLFAENDPHVKERKTAETTFGTQSFIELGDNDPATLFLAREEDNTEASRMEYALSCLTLRERAVLHARFGMRYTMEKTLGEVGEDIGVTKERVRQIEAKALRKLRRRLNREWCGEFYG